jgi:hypothetical protein
MICTCGLRAIRVRRTVIILRSTGPCSPATSRLTRFAAFLSGFCSVGQTHWRRPQRRGRSICRMTSLTSTPDVFSAGLRANASRLFRVGPTARAGESGRVTPATTFLASRTFATTLQRRLDCRERSSSDVFESPSHMQSRSYPRQVRVQVSHARGASNGAGHLAGLEFVTRKRQDRRMKTKIRIGTVALLALALGAGYWLGHQHGSSSMRGRVNLASSDRQIGLTFRQNRNDIGRFSATGNASPTKTRTSER